MFCFFIVVYDLGKLRLYFSELVENKLLLELNSDSLKNLGLFKRLNLKKLEKYWLWSNSLLKFKILLLRSNPRAWDFLEKLLKLNLLKYSILKLSWGDTIWDLLDFLNLSKTSLQYFLIHLFCDLSWRTCI